MSETESDPSKIQECNLNDGANLGEEYVFNISQIFTRETLCEKFKAAQKNKRAKELEFIKFIVEIMIKRVLKENEQGKSNYSYIYSGNEVETFDSFIEIEKILKSIFVDSVIKIIKLHNSTMRIEIDWSEISKESITNSTE